MGQFAARESAGVCLAVTPEHTKRMRMAGSVVYSVADMPQPWVGTLSPISAVFPVGNLPMIALLARIRARVRWEGYSGWSNRDFVREGRDGDLFGNGD
jgi:hypothetical protein